MIRPATPHDAAQAAPLLCAAWGHLVSILTGTCDEDEAVQIVSDFFARPRNRISFENTLVAEIDGRVAGVAVCYHGSQAEALDRPLAEQLAARTGDPAAVVQTEAAPDEFYLDTLSVHPDFQRRGLGMELLRAFELRAVEQGYATLGLLVEEGNEAASRLYAKAGYTPDRTQRLAGLNFDHWENRRCG